MDSNHDKGLQRALCYHYTIGQTSGRKRSSHAFATQAEKTFASTKSTLAAFETGCLKSSCSNLRRKIPFGNPRSQTGDGRFPIHLGISCVSVQPDYPTSENR